MTERYAYSYTVLRYVHDILTGEFVNVGVVIFVPDTGEVEVKLRPTVGRIKSVFPDLDRQAFTQAMISLKVGLKEVIRLQKASPLLKSHSDAVALASAALAADDSSLQWSPAGSGVTSDMANTLNRIYGRFVGRYDHHDVHRRNDEDIWRHVQKRLAARNLDVPFVEKTIVGSTDEIAFKHAWKNGVWHAYEPISFDLADSDGIKDKARGWLGHLSAVADGATEDFKLNLIVGMPHAPDLGAAYKKALEILEKSPFTPTIVEEENVDALVDKIASEMDGHDAAKTAVQEAI